MRESKRRADVETHVARPYQIVGRPASSGVHRGIARLVFDRGDFGKITPGDIGVSHTASPELALVLDRAGALVTDVGGVLSHVAVVARERGVPVVVATEVASKRISDGSIVVVDGDRGVVTVEDDVRRMTPSAERSSGDRSRRSRGKTTEPT